MRGGGAEWFAIGVPYDGGGDRRELEVVSN
jgi:hypothetical protein